VAPKLTRLDCPYNRLYTSFVASIREDRIEIRAKRRESRSWRAAAKRADVTLSEWIRETLNQRAVPPLPAVPRTVSGEQLPLPRVK